VWATLAKLVILAVSLTRVDMEDPTFARWVAAVKWLMGGLAVVAAFLLVQNDVTVAPLLKVALGAFLAFAAYVNPQSIVAAVKK
jgi:hypothetical protein